jgi:ComF family protein
VRALADSLIAVLLAPLCAACDAPLDTPTRGPVCEGCWSGVRAFSPPLCNHCGDPLPSWRHLSLEQQVCPRCRRARSALSSVRAIGPYEGPLRAIVHALKYGGRRSIAPRLGELMRSTADGRIDDVDVAVPVPLHWRRQRVRGFNQADDLARLLGIPVLTALTRVRSTTSQTDLPAARRHANVRGAFRLRWRTRVSGLRVVLVDDVCTTGATLEACARVLREAGAEDVRAITAARVASPPPGSRRR